jgi:hypothetical protein
MAGITGIAAEMKRLREAVKELEKAAIVEMKKATVVVLQELFARTPVWSGETVRNYVVGVGVMPSGGPKSALGTGDPGPTNSMRMGTEDRRPENESAALSEAQAALSRMTRLKSIFITNTVDGLKWSLIDSGSAPGGPDQVVRNEGGTSKIAEMNARARLAGKFK